MSDVETQSPLVYTEPCFDIESPTGTWKDQVKTGDAVTATDAVSGQVRARVVKTAPGNAEKLAP
jgi:hypothetical protein